MAENKTKPTNISVDEYIDAIENDVRRKDARFICDLMHQITGEPAVLWGPSIIGFGKYHYKYESGREGESLKIGFSPRKAELVLYIALGMGAHAENLAKLGPHKTGKGCLYIKSVDKIDMAVLKAIIELAWREVCAKYDAP